MAKSEMARLARNELLPVLRFGSAERYGFAEAEKAEAAAGVWYERECANLSAALVRVLNEKHGIEARMLVGTVSTPTRAFNLHAWVELPDGSWIDPTSATIGWPEALILMPDDERRACYGAVAVKDEHLIPAFAGTSGERWHPQ
jgi:hypothetical protein